MRPFLTIPIRPVFTLSMPRSRTAWFAAYLNGLGIPAYHEAWKYAKNAKELRELWNGHDLVVNSDSCNILFYDEIRQEFPEAQFIKINRSLEEVKRSAELAYGEIDENILDRWYSILQKLPADREVEFEEWGPGQSYELVRFITDKWIDMNWHTLAHDLKIEVNLERVFKDHILVSSGAVDHITAKLRG